MGVVQLGSVQMGVDPIGSKKVQTIKKVTIKSPLKNIRSASAQILTMRFLLIAVFLAPACTGFFAARVSDHSEKKFKKPECHLEWEDVTTPHCETSHEQV